MYAGYSLAARSQLSEHSETKTIILLSAAAAAAAASVSTFYSLSLLFTIE